MLELKPSEIRYSQGSISSHFSNGKYHISIGKTLDLLLAKTIHVNQIPKITVTKIGNLWYTYDNRRLWVFRNAAEFGVVNNIRVKHENKPNLITRFTTHNEGKSIEVRGNPGGLIWRSRERIRTPILVYEPPVYRSDKPPSTSAETLNAASPVPGDQGFIWGGKNMSCHPAD